jgi:hypothetical protein
MGFSLPGEEVTSLFSLLWMRKLPLYFSLPWREKVRVRGELNKLTTFRDYCYHS